MSVKISLNKFSVFSGPDPLLQNVSLEVQSSQILGVIGPSGSGKTTFLRSLNRMNELQPGFRIEGRALLDGEDIYGRDYDAVSLRKKVGMVFAMPVPLPMSIHENITYGPKLSADKGWKHDEAVVEKSLKAAFLWDEVKDRLRTSALRLSGGQQQRLCLARTLTLEPEVILLDEPCSGLDPISTAKIEEALTILKERYTVILVTNNTKQAARVSDRTAFFLMGQLVEEGLTQQMFTAPKDKKTSDYITGRFG
ncbi:phosphate ABC transporter ATP-binding protein [candidate division TA06 bacterium]|uniref:Phosphate ABC transporter ATP-binding protein n=1 Tax=candidate division TA06 bacterium TaxID=2250710 RepID=A0A933MIR8_UNCT6|nr:phosphate ABC transporter ATP-binding protein [candidate division TA06 bacterium]